MFCESKKSLEKGGGTVHMVKTAMLFMIEKYSYIKYVDVEDNTFIDIQGEWRFGDESMCSHGDLVWIQVN
jgi:hypothetical protein